MKRFGINRLIKKYLDPKSDKVYNYSTCSDSAKKLLNSLNFTYKNLEWLPEEESWRCEVGTIERRITSYAKTLPMAICLAVLKERGIEVEVIHKKKVFSV
ncbi:hypothetical protein ACTHP5_20215 [Bacillus subtilis]|uniref:Uncharacterized protein n=1 Tax=Bacillus subtilis TaxID=1423 RepID=A0A1J0AKL7_BACIU|nr:MULTISPECIES: hypothetical protein [Bacillus]APB62281.1 hypothetical protein pBS72_0120 [Bacillus subtilis]MEC2297449.1 hypothetical protein [Bacillus subtilis]MEC3664916.1 hypothetical protein [Bacillus subtilis]NUF07768.1 hypothetical protein [Bacillus rugosus]GLI90677.1 hypothetical protein ANABIO4_40290 [Bacillus subtilis]